MEHTFSIAAEIPPDIERQLELLEREALDRLGPEVMAYFSAMARHYLYSTLTPHKWKTVEIDGYRVTSLADGK